MKLNPKLNNKLAFFVAPLAALFFALLSFLAQPALALTMTNILSSPKVLGDSTSAYVYPSGSLVLDNSGTVYFICGTIKIPFTNFQAFTGLGYSLKNVVKGDLSAYTPAQTYTVNSANAEHPWCQYLLYKGTVYYSGPNGLIGVPDAQTFLSNSGNWALVVPANSFDLAVLNSNINLPPLAPADTRVTTNQADIQISNTATNTGNLMCPANSACSPTPTPIPLPPTPTTVVNNCQGTAASNGQCVSAPVIVGISPLSAAVGTAVTITGTGFLSAGNTVNFGSGVIPDLPSANGTTINFTVPDALNPSCYYSKPACSIATMQTSPGQYSVSVSNTGGTSNGSPFTVTSAGIICPTNASCAPAPTPTPIGFCEHPSPPQGCSYVGDDTYPNCAAQLVCTSHGPTETAPLAISSLSPSSGTTGTSVTVTGTGFTTSGNTVNFGVGVIQNLNSSNGTSLTFSVPSSIAPYCTPGTACPQYILSVTPNNYNVSVTNANGTSNALSFAVTSSAGTCPSNALCMPLNTLSVTSPAGGEQWAIGSTHAITWTAPSSITAVNIVLQIVVPPCPTPTPTGKGTAVVCNNGQLPAPITIAQNVPNSGSYNWYIDPGKFYAGNFTLTISDAGSSGSSINSSSFTLVK